MSDSVNRYDNHLIQNSILHTFVQQEHRINGTDNKLCVYIYCVYIYILIKQTFIVFEGHALDQLMTKLLTHERLADCSGQLQTSGWYGEEHRGHNGNFTPPNCGAPSTFIDQYQSPLMVQTITKPTYYTPTTKSVLIL